MKKFLLGMFFFAFIQGVEAFEEKFKAYQDQFPQGDLEQISYIKSLLDKMYDFDQTLRKDFIKNWSILEKQEILRKMDTFHTLKMKEILQRYGWITISKFGAEYDRKAWLLVQHADHDPFFQAGVLFLLGNLIPRKETDQKNYAYLYDRVALKFPSLGFRQRYGTQVLSKTKGEIILQPCEGTFEEVDHRRKEIGLEPLREYLKQVKEMVENSF